MTISLSSKVKSFFLITFIDSDSPYFLAYSIIIMHTMNHNPNVPPQRKISKDQFISQNKKSVPGFPEQKLSQIYDRIMA